jgi:hypothetical protein
MNKLKWEKAIDSNTMYKKIESLFREETGEIPVLTRNGNRRLKRQNLNDSV